MEAASVTAIVSGINSSLGIQSKPKRITTSLGKDFEDALFRMISPNLLTHRLDHRGISAWTFHHRCYCAALASIEPAVRTKPDAVDDRMRIFKPESFKQNFRITVRDIILVSIRDCVDFT